VDRLHALLFEESKDRLLEILSLHDIRLQHESRGVVASHRRQSSKLHLRQHPDRVAASFTIQPGVGHMMPIEDPDGFLALLEAIRA